MLRRITMLLFGLMCLKDCPCAAKGTMRYHLMRGELADAVHHSLTKYEKALEGGDKREKVKWLFRYVTARGLSEAPYLVKPESANITPSLVAIRAGEERRKVFGKLLAWEWEESKDYIVAAFAEALHERIGPGLEQVDVLDKLIGTVRERLREDIERQRKAEATQVSFPHSLSSIRAMRGEHLLSYCAAHIQASKVSIPVPAAGSVGALHAEGEGVNRALCPPVKDVSRVVMPNSSHSLPSDPQPPVGRPTSRLRHAVAAARVSSPSSVECDVRAAGKDEAKQPGNFSRRTILPGLVPSSFDSLQDTENSRGLNIQESSLIDAPSSLQHSRPRRTRYHFTLDKGGKFQRHSLPLSQHKAQRNFCPEDTFPAAVSCSHPASSSLSPQARGTGPSRPRTSGLPSKPSSSGVPTSFLPARGGP